MFPSNAGNMSMGGLNNNGNVNGGNMGAGLGFGMNNNGSQMHGNMANGVQSQETGNSQSTSEYTLAGILHHLQSEWRRYEKDRNEWEIERAELRARIALLEGERRGVENLKTDLMRRVKMLEYALRQERSKYLSSGGSTINSQSASSPLSANAPPAKNPLLQGLEKGTSSSGRSSPAPFPEAAPTASAIAAAAGSAGATGTGLLSRSTSSAKDPKSRAKSREYLKQCLQEISYLTSASTLNPLPDRGIASGSAANGTNMQSALRPRKTMLENVPPTLPAPTESHAALAGSISRASGAALGIPNAKGGRPGRSPLFASEPVLEETNEAEEPQEGGLETVPEQREVDGAEQLNSGASESVAALKNPLSATFAEPETSSSASPEEAGEEQREQDEAPGSSGSSDSSRSSQSTDSRGNSAGSMTDQEMDEQEQVTAIFKPGGRDWQKLKEAGIKSRERRESERQGQAAEEASIISEAQQQLAITSEKVNQLMNRSGRAAGSERKDEEELANLSLVAEDDEAAKEAAEAAADSLLWKSKKRAILGDRRRHALGQGGQWRCGRGWPVGVGIERSVPTGDQLAPQEGGRGRAGGQVPPDSSLLCLGRRGRRDSHLRLSGARCCLPKGIFESISRRLRLLSRADDGRAWRAGSLLVKFWKFERMRASSRQQRMHNVHTRGVRGILPIRSGRATLRASAGATRGCPASNRLGRRNHSKSKSAPQTHSSSILALRLTRNELLGTLLIGPTKPPDTVPPAPPQHAITKALAPPNITPFPSHASIEFQHQVFGAPGSLDPPVSVDRHHRLPTSVVTSGSRRNTALTLRQDYRISPRPVTQQLLPGQVSR
ncbi:hypothetical protein L1887_51735 [Cichorium endivia]|nr:hypothetical protein L1887_51735 [Cichorium endivia]